MPRKGDSLTQTIARRLHCVFLGAFLVLACAFPLTAGQADDGIPWDATRQLVWSDFQGALPANSAAYKEPASIHMTIHWHVSFTATCTNGRTWTGHVASAEVTNVMSPALSWAVPGHVDALILQHEQTHFDLNEVYRRKLEAVLLCIQSQGTSEQTVVDALNVRVQGVADSLLDRLEEIQDQYDAETSPGLNQAVQYRWTEQVREWLDDPSLAPS